MNECPNCGNKMRVTNTYSVGDSGKTQRLFCDKCYTVATTVTIVVNVDPRYGEGAAMLAKRIREGERPWG